MTLKTRLIPCLDVMGGRVVKGVQFVDLRDAGDPVEAAMAYDAAGADELTFLDITASHEGRDTIFDVVARTADHCFMPVTVGGGVRTIEDIRKLLLAGADKVAINSAAVNDPDFISRAADKFGNQCIVVSVDAKQTTNIGTRTEALLKDAISRIPAMAEQQTQRFDAYRNYTLSKQRGDAALIECVRLGILNAKDIGKAIKEWDEPSHVEHSAEGRTAWTLFNSVTEAIKPANPERAHILSAWERTIPLTNYLDRGVGLIH